MVVSDEKTFCPCCGKIVIRSFGTTTGTLHNCYGVVRVESKSVEKVKKENDFIKNKMKKYNQY